MTDKMIALWEQAPASGSGGEKTMGLVAEGISEALITTETGLIIALPGLFFQYQLSRQLDRYKALLAQLETICTQNLYKELRARKEAAPKRTETLPRLEPAVRSQEAVLQPWEIAA